MRLRGKRSSELLDRASGRLGETAARRSFFLLDEDQEMTFWRTSDFGTFRTLGRILPVGRKMTRPTTLSITDIDGTRHECIAEAFDTTHNVIILLYPIKALDKTTIILPPGFRKVV
jgi:hypothetical protein